nr:MAG TPA: hypothetical protein [Crassvirales sp.]
MLMLMFQIRIDKAIHCFYRGSYPSKCLAK